MESQGLDWDRVSIQGRDSRASRRLPGIFSGQEGLPWTADVTTEERASPFQFPQHFEEESAWFVHGRHQSHEERFLRAHVERFAAATRCHWSVDGVSEEGHRVELQFSAEARLRGKIDDEPPEADASAARR